MICKNCGYENAETSAFCAECGAPLVREEAIAPETANDLPAENAPQAFDAPEATEAPEAPEVPEVPQYAAPETQGFAAAPVPPQPFAPYPQHDAPAYSAPQAPAFAAPQTPAPAKKSGKGFKIAMIATVAVLALALIAAGVFCYLLYTEKVEREEEDGALRTQLSEMEGKLSQANDDYDTLSGSYDSLADEYAALSDKYDTLTNDYTALSGKYDELDAAYNELYDYSNGLYEDYSGMYDEYRFFKAHAVICSDMNKYYHTYSCTEWDHSGFWIYNVDNAIGKGFTACPTCHQDG